MNELLDSIAEMLLSSDSVSEADKLSINIVRAGKRVSQAIHDQIVTRYAKPGEEANVETLKEVLEYLKLMEVGISQFVESTPFVAKEN